MANANFSQEEVRNLYVILRKIDFLSEVTVDDIDGAMSKFQKLIFSAGKKVIEQGSPGRGLFVIKTGSCLVYRKKGFFGREKLAEIKSGGFFGEMSLVYDNPVSATIVTLEPSEIYAYSKKDFLGLVEKNPALKSRLQKLADKRTSENVLGK